MVALSKSPISQEVLNAVTQVVETLMINKYGNIYDEHGKLNPIYASEFEAMYYQISDFIYKTIK